MPPPGRSWFRGSLSSVSPAGSSLALTKNPARGLTTRGISSGGRISYGTAWPGRWSLAGSHSLPPVPSRTKNGGRPRTLPAWRSSRSGISPLVK